MNKNDEETKRLPDVVKDLPIAVPNTYATLVVRTDDKAIYKRCDDVWEVFRIKIEEEQTIFGKKYPRREVYPGNEDFGSIAWCFTNEESAMKRYKAL